MNANRSKKNRDNTVRIIAGKWRGRKLSFADVDGLRPTGDRIRETLFNWLAPFIEGADCLDLFAGSGALSLEALSRGASAVTAVDASAQVQVSLKAAAHTLAERHLDIVAADACDWLRSAPPVAYDIVFLDPPFNTDLLNESIEILNARGWLTRDTLIYIEQDKGGAAANVPSHWLQIKEKSAGLVSYGLFRVVCE